ncbi:hypothetical protein [Pseudodesulfovibrio sediminis]|uniref:Uncharacterized protein n=1 Tax=Pseudodesulfovibrio sediminis TaxID=2810563 RepID=A0ABN6EMR6_9BACT|nr:hypothetical protein [Pseudodesulfovibrio sediminis]BCS87357.1 hypothetical protein PSDVSF_05990 [Pseudodesulfovibrio sediminis]
MTKAELISALEGFPDTYDVRVFATIYCPHADDVRCCDHDGINIGHTKHSRGIFTPWGSVLKAVSSDDRGTAVLLETTIR